MTKEEILAKAKERIEDIDWFNYPAEAWVDGYEYANQEKQVWVKTDCVPYQLCPKCNGQGTVSKPSYVPGDVDQWTSSAVAHLCDICNGSKIIPMFVLPQKPEV